VQLLGCKLWNGGTTSPTALLHNDTERVKSLFVTRKGLGLRQDGEQMADQEGRGSPLSPLQQQSDVQGSDTGNIGSNKTISFLTHTPLFTDQRILSCSWIIFKLICKVSVIQSSLLTIDSKNALNVLNFSKQLLQINFIYNSMRSVSIGKFVG